MSFNKLCQNPACGQKYYFWSDSKTTLTCPYCYSLYSKTWHQPTTQKARGLIALRQHYANDHAPVMPIIALLCASKEVGELSQVVTNAMKAGTLFARPCPPSPEHGFVESKVVKSVEELEALRLATLAANPDSEIMLVEAIDAKWNAVWTPTLLGIGPGHDGATSGKGAVALPLCGASNLSPELLAAAGLADGAAPYIEAVGDPHPILCQLRGGPPLASGISPDFIPSGLTVEDVITTNGEDLLEWAKIIRTMKGKPGVIVYHPGGLLTDHYSVHCRENGVAIVTTFKPDVGQVLEATSSTLPPLDPMAMLEGLAAADKATMGTDHVARMWIALMLLANHNAPVMRGASSFYIGAGVAALLKLGSAALRVEARHAHSLPKGVNGKPAGYDFYGRKTISFHRAGVSRVSQLLHYGFGEVNQGHSYGGPKWSLCGAALCPLFDAVRNLAASQTAEAASACLVALNIAINQAHNGGWWLNKFIDEAAYNLIPQGDPGWACVAAPIVMELQTLRKGVKLDAWIAKVAAWPDTIIKPLRWRKASLDVGPGSFELELKPATIPTKQRIMVPLTPKLLSNLIDHLGKVEISPGKVDLVVPTKAGEEAERISLWSEQPIIARERNIKDRSTW